MTIHEFNSIRSRSRIGLVGELPTKELCAALPGYELYSLTIGSLATPGLLETTAAAIIRQSEKHPREIADQLAHYAPTLLRHGCLVFVQPLKAKQGTGDWALARRKFIVDAIEKDQLPFSGLTGQEIAKLGPWATSAEGPVLTPLVHVLTIPDDWQGVQLHLQLHLPGEARAGTSILFPNRGASDHRLDPEHELLIRRAFSDCSEVQLEPLRNGLSGIDAYRVYALQRADEAGGRWPYRYFVKIGDRAKISTEFLHYRDIALEHLPYHLGPRLRLDRCELGHRHGIIVSDYVAGAEPLRDCARDGRAVAAIANLFNITFRAWHNGAAPSDLPLQEYLRERVPSVIPHFRKPLVDRLGARKALQELNAQLLAGSSSPVMVGIVHGDLHATNVLVRDGDAILIDFEKVEKKAPLLRDMACLEGGLFVDGFVGDRREPQAILESVKCLYSSDALLQGRLTACHPSDGSSWFFDCVMQVRLHARQIERSSGQYAIALASELLRKACNDHNFDLDAKQSHNAATFGTPSTDVRSQRVRMEQTRAMAYIIAEWILLELKPPTS